MDFSVVPFEESFVDACAAMAAAAPDPWQKQAFTRIVLDENRPCFVVVSNGEPIAFAAFMLVCGSADLELVAVREDCRRRGVATALLSHALAALAARGAGRVLLELRVSNKGAARLYQKLGFAVLARRPGMYAAPKEDGLLMARTLAGTAGGPPYKTVSN